MIRHSKEHIGKAIAKVEARREETLIEQIERYRQRLETSLTGAERAEDWRGVAALVREIRGFPELVARLTGQIRPGSVGVQVNTGSTLNQTELLQAIARCAWKDLPGTIWAEQERRRRSKEAESQGHETLSLLTLDQSVLTGQHRADGRRLHGIDEPEKRAEVDEKSGPGWTSLLSS